MEIQKITDAEVESSDAFESLDFKFNEDAMSLMFKSFTDSLYSNKIGSIVREIVSNAADANQENNSVKPVEIHLETLITDSLELTVKDYGKGLSPALIKDTYTQYFASTKRGTNEQIGGWGIGAKTPLSYAKSFYLITHHGNKKYKYLVSRGENAPQINLIFTEDSTDIGTSVVINFKKDDLVTLNQELQSQLKYFDNINYYGCSIDNNYKLYYFNNFIVKPDNSKLELSLGRVRYPIMDSVIDDSMSDIEGLKGKLSHLHSSNIQGLPIALKFDIGELDVTLSREQLEYTDKTKSAIRTRIQDAIEEINDLVAVNDKTYNNLESFFEENTQDVSEGNYIKLEDDTYFSLSDRGSTSRYSSYRVPVFKSPKVIIKSLSTDDRSFLASDLHSIGYYLNFTQRTVSYGKPTSVKKSVNTLYRLASKSILNFIDSLEDNKMILLDEKFNRNKLLYLANNGLSKNDSTYDKTEYTINCAEFNFKDESDTDKQSKVVKEVYAFLNKKLTVSSNIEVPENWLTKYKEINTNTKKAVDNTKINLISVSGGAFRTKLSLEDLRSKKGMIIYGTQDNRSALDSANRILTREEKHYALYVCSIDNLHYFDNNPRFIYIEDINNYLQKKFINICVIDRIDTLRRCSNAFSFYKFHFSNSVSNLSKKVDILDEFYKSKSHYIGAKYFMGIELDDINIEEYECIFIHKNQAYDIIQVLKSAEAELEEVYSLLYPTNKMLYKSFNNKKQ